MLPLAYGACLAIYAGVALALAAGAPPALALMEALTLPLAWQFTRSVERRSASGPGDEAIAGRGVALFFLVSFFGLLAYLADYNSPDATGGANARLKKTKWKR